MAKIEYETKSVMWIWIETLFRMLRREGGVSQKFLIFLLFRYVITPHILFPKWAYLPLNSLRLLRYDSAKLGHFRPFSSICIGKSLKFAYKFLHFFKNLSHQILQLTPNLVSTFRDMKSRNTCKGFVIFNFLGIFLAILQIFAKNLS